MKLDATRIISGLYQGSEPPPGYAVTGSGFDVLVLCAEEIQPPDRDFPMVRVLRCPLDDNPDVPVTRADWELVLRTARRVVGHLRQRERVLVTCQMGINRSGLVVAATLHLLTGIAGCETAQVVRNTRQIMHQGKPWKALSNPQFQALLCRELPERRPSFR